MKKESVIQISVADMDVIELYSKEDIFNTKDIIVYHIKLTLEDLVETALSISLTADGHACIYVPDYLAADIFNAFSVIAGNKIDGFQFDYSKDYKGEYRISVGTCNNYHVRLNKSREENFGIEAIHVHCPEGWMAMVSNSVVFVYSKDISKEVFKSLYKCNENNKIIVFDLID